MHNNIYMHVYNIKDTDVSAYFLHMYVCMCVCVYKVLNSNLFMYKRMHWLDSKVY